MLNTILVDNRRENNDRHFIFATLLDLDKFEQILQAIFQKMRGLGHGTLKILGISVRLALKEPSSVLNSCIYRLYLAKKTLQPVVNY